MSHDPPTKKRTSTNNNEEDDNDSNLLPIPPDGGWGWMVVLASFAIHIVTDGMTYSFGVFYVEFLDYFQEGKGKTAWIASILVGVTLCSGPISSSLVNRYGCRAVTIAGSILAGICLIASVFAKSVFVLFITIGVGAGFGFGLIYLPAIVCVTMYFERLRSLATGIAVCGSGFGTFIFAPLTEVLIRDYGWRGAMLVIAAIVFNCAIFGALFRPLEPPKPKNKHSTELLGIKEEEPGAPVNNGNGNSNSYGNVLSAQNSASHQNITRTHSVGATYMKTSSSNKLLANYPHTKKQSIDNHSAIRLALSQPLLNQGEGEHQRMKRTESGTMYRMDALYTGSTTNLSRTQLSAHDDHHYGSIRRKSSFMRVPKPEPETVMCGCISCSQETRDAFTEMMNFSLFKDPVFIIFLMSNFLTSIGFNVPYVYLVAQAESLNIANSSFLLSIIGIANTIGRIILGYLSDKPWVNRLLVYNMCLSSCGAATIASIWCLDFYSLATYSAVFGFTIGAYVGLTSVILVDLLGLDKLTNAFGLLLLFQGIASFLGPPIAGTLYDYTLSYKPGFLLAGITILMSGIMLFLIPPVKKCVQRRATIIAENGNATDMVPL